MRVIQALRGRVALARISSAVLLHGLIGLFVFASAASAAGGAGNCPNEAFRKGRSARLPDCRAYEMVSPVYKGGFGATHIEAVSEDGDRAAFFSPGEFAGAPAGLSNNANGLDYLSDRGESGWSTTPVMPPAQLAPFVNHHDISTNLSSTLALGKPGPTVEAADLEGAESEFLLHDTGTSDLVANWERVGAPLRTLTGRTTIFEYDGANTDFCHLLFSSSEEGSGAGFQLLESAIGVQRPLYELNRGCHGEQAGLRLVAVNDQSKPISAVCQSEPGIYSFDTYFTSAYGAISADGDELFFTTCVKNEPSDHQLFVRLGGTRTLEVSRPIEPQLETCGENQIPCPKAGERPSADFVGASENGSKVFFTTTAALVGEDQDSGNDLYMAEIGCPVGEAECQIGSRRVTRLVLVSRDPRGQASGVEGAVRVAPDGARVYFVATGDLLSEAAQQALESAGRAIPHIGADNLYVYDDVSGEMSFIGDLCSGYELSGAVDDSRCPSKTGVDTRLWYGLGEHEIQTAGASGQFLVFASYAQLTANDTDAAKDVYRYDAEVGSLERVSLGEEGYSSNGNGAFDADIAVGQRGESVKSQYELANRAISEDGSRIVFSSAERLSPAVVNGLTNVYEWHANEAAAGGGNVSLISGGTGETPAEDPVISPQGNDVFFVTTVGLVPQDTDGEADIYDARIDGGFPRQPASREPCSSDACQGPVSNPAPALVPGSSLQAPGEDFTSPASPQTATPKKAAAKCAKAKRLGRGKCVKRKSKKKAKAKKRSTKSGKRKVQSRTATNDRRDQS